MPATLSPTLAIDPRAEARERLGAGFEPRVHEPSPPALRPVPDPYERGDVPAGAKLVSPILGGGDVTFDDLCRDDADLATWCAERWLGAYRRLPVPPASLAGTRTALHRVAAYAILPAQRSAMRLVSLRFTRGGFGTAFFGDDRQLRVEAGDLIVQQGTEAARLPLTTLQAASEAIGHPLAPEVAEEFEVPAFGDPNAALAIEREAARWIGDWFGFATSVLGDFRATTTAEDSASRVRLWPEHFDVAIEAGAEGKRGSFGLSLGDDHIAEPYVYVSPWGGPPDADPFWNAPFGGASLPFSALADATDQRAAAIAFLAEGLGRRTGR